MKILMLGWEYPPHISGGLGRACEGLTGALAKCDVDIDFVVPHLFGNEHAPHMNLIDGISGEERVADRFQGGSHLRPRTELRSEVLTAALEKRIRTVMVPAQLSPYWTPQTFLTFKDLIKATAGSSTVTGGAVLEQLGVSVAGREEKYFEQYGGDLFSEVGRYAGSLVSLFAEADFDLVHAHDWMTFPAGMALKSVTGKPLIVHVHSLEFDRSGVLVNERICAIERAGMEAADVVIAVSYYTRSLIQKHYGIPAEKILVVHNGVYTRQEIQSYKGERQWPSKVVLFLGRVTFQKGPDYFVEVAARVIPHIPEVLFVMAGTGDMLHQLVKRVNSLGISKNFLFTGFLKGQEVEQMLSTADLYVMPSVSEPFGISALEAISYDVPVIISRQSGVSEVLRHALKADFWDLDRMADLIINALLHAELRNDIVTMAREEVKRLHWQASAQKTKEIYAGIQR